MEITVPVAHLHRSHIHDLLDEGSRLRLDELRDAIDAPTHHIDAALIDLLEDGHLSLLSIGDVVVVRPE